MDYSSANTALWNGIIQMGLIAAAVIFSNMLRRKIAFIRKSLLPTSVLAGFLLLALKASGLLRLDVETLETLTYHGLAIGFIAMSLRIPRLGERSRDLVAPKSGMLIVCCYLAQGIAGLLITLFLSYTFMPSLFKAAGVLLPMGYGQGPGQANNIGSSYEALGFAGGRSFGLALAAAGYLCACVAGIVYLNILVRRGKVRAQATEGIGDAVTVDAFEDKGEVPVAESLDRLSVQIALVMLVYMLMKGKKLHGKRNHINRFRATTAFEYRALHGENAGECMELYQAWLEHKDPATPGILGEQRALEFMLPRLDELQLYAGGIYVDNALMAFSVGEKLHDDVAIIHIGKASHMFPELYAVINQQFAEHAFSDVVLINREEDMGIEGMRKAKLSYDPVKLIEKYDAAPAK